MENTTPQQPTQTTLTAAPSVSNEAVAAPAASSPPVSAPVKSSSPTGSSKGLMVLVAVIIVLFIAGLAYVLLSHKVVTPISQPVIKPLPTRGVMMKGFQTGGVSGSASMTQDQMSAMHDNSDTQLSKDSADIQNTMDKLNTDSANADQSLSNQSTDTQPTP